MSKIRAAITGVHGWVPDYILTNAELEKMVDTTDEWITSRSGIKERRILKGEGQGASVIGAGVVKGLLEKTGTRPEDIDLLIISTVTPDYAFPSTANIVCEKAGLKNDDNLGTVADAKPDKHHRDQGKCRHWPDQFDKRICNVFHNS